MIYERLKYEYFYKRRYPAEEENLTWYLSHLGEEGWRMVTAHIDNEGCWNMIFIREVIPDGEGL